MMGKEKTFDGSKDDLRRRAEERIRTDETAGGEKSGSGTAPPAGDRERIFHELQVRQIELELQNDELHRTFRELEISRARYQDLYDFAPVPYFSVGEDGKIREANLTAATLLGVGRADLLRRPFARFVCPEDRDLYDRQKEALLISSEPQAFELRMSGPDAAPFWGMLKAVSAKDEDGSVVIRIAVADISERKEAEASLREVEWKFRALFENGPIGVAYHRMIYDGSGKPVDYLFLDANEKYLELTGVDPRGKTVTQAFPGIKDDPFDWIGVFGNVARTGESARFERYLQLNHRWYDGVAYRYKPDHFVAAFFEITARKQAEEALKTSLGEKDVLMRELAHRTKNNMQVIGNLIKLQAATMTDRKLVEVLEDTQDRIRAMALVHDSIYRSESLVALGMKGYARNLVASLLRAHRGTSGTVTPVIEIEDIPTPIDAAVGLGLIINELTTNSLKHAFPGGKHGKIFLSLRRIGEGVELRYGDDGPGLPPGVDLERTQSLGLKLVRTIAERQLRGKMEVRRDSPPEFVFRFDTFSHMEGR